MGKGVAVDLTRGNKISPQAFIQTADTVCEKASIRPVVSGGECGLTNSSTSGRQLPVDCA